MDQMISILRAIEEQKNPTLNSNDNNIKILELYKTIYEIVNDKNSYVEQSTVMLNALSENNLSEEEKQQWLAYAAGIFASYMAVKLYEERGIVTVLTDDELLAVIDEACKKLGVKLDYCSHRTVTS